MVSRRALVGVVLALAVVQVLFEDALVFVGATGGDTGSIPPVVYVAVPGAISLLLFVVLFGSALVASDRTRPTRRFRE